MPGLDGRVRHLRPDEADAWCACHLRPGEAGYEEWLEGERDWLSRWPGHRERLFAYEAADGLLGKVDVPFERPGRWELWAPTVRDGPDAQSLLHALVESVAAEAGRRGIRRVDVILEEGHRHREAAMRALIEADFERREERIVVVLDLGPALPEEPSRIETVPASAIGFEELRALAPRCGMEADEVADLVDGRPEVRHGVIARRADRSVGVALPSAAPGEETFTLRFLGVVPELRGKGVGPGLLWSVLEAARTAGSGVYVGSTETRNEPMRRVFARLGCEITGRRSVFSWLRREVPPES